MVGIFPGKPYAKKKKKTSFIYPKMISIGFFAFSITSIPSVITRPFVTNNSKEKT